MRGDLDLVRTLCSLRTREDACACMLESRGGSASPVALLRGRGIAESAIEELMATLGQETQEEAETELRKIKKEWPGRVQRSNRKFMICGSTAAAEVLH